MKRLRLKTLRVTGHSGPDGNLQVALTGLDERGRVWSFDSLNGRWFPVSMEVVDDGNDDDDDDIRCSACGQVI